VIPASTWGRPANPAAPTFIAGAIALIGGLTIAYMDSRPGYDDTGVAAVLLIAVAAIAAAIAGRRPWLWALLVGIWTPIIEISSGGSTGSLLALAFAAAGAVVGYLAARGARSR
jgi:uncharacterized membrane protein